MKSYAVGDVHGCFTALKTLFDFVDPKPGDLVVMLGDYVDRGPNSRGVLEWLINRSADQNLVCLKGNHEIMMLESRRDIQQRRRWGSHGGAATWDSYSDATDSSHDDLRIIPASHWQFLNSLHRYHETDTHVFVHAAAYGDLAMEEQPDYVLFWERFGMITPREDGKVVVCGHTSQKDGLPKSNEFAVCIDTNACRGGWLTCLDVETREYFQANEDRETRTGWLD